MANLEPDERQAVTEVAANLKSLCAALNTRGFLVNQYRLRKGEFHELKKWTERLERIANQEGETNG